MIGPRRTPTWPFLVAKSKKEEHLPGVRQLVGALEFLTKAVPRRRTPKRCVISLTWIYVEIEIEIYLGGVVESVLESKNIIASSSRVLLKDNALRYRKRRFGVVPT